MTQSLDESVGRVLERLEQRGLTELTLVIFTSDNGGYINNYDNRPVTNNAPLRSGKGSLYEEGVRIPLIVRWPGVTPAGALCHVPVVSTDVYWSIREATGHGGEAPPGERDGLSLVSLLKDPGARLDRDTLYWHYPHYYPTTTPVSALRDGDWKLLEYHEDQHVELYDLSEDLGETRDLAATNTEKTEQLLSRLHAWQTAVGARMPTPNPEWKANER
jgi:arylsulfatase A-like enzyme